MCAAGDILKNLGDLRVGEAAVISRVSERFAGRLAAIGFREGEEVVCAFKSPLGGFTAYFARGVLTALRTADASGIKVKVL